jgi:neutral ceramidase
MRTKAVIVLSVALAAGIGPLAAQAPAPATSLRVGAARVDVTPPAAPGAPPQTYEHQRLYLRAIVVDNGTTRAVIIGADQGNLADDVWTNASRAIASELNIPTQNILMSATHTHSTATTGPGQAAPGRAGGAAPAAPAPAAANAAPPPLVAPMLQAVRQARAALRVWGLVRAPRGST